MNPTFLLLFVCLIAGGVLRVSGKFPKSAPQAFNGFVIWVSLPAVILLQIPKLLDTVQINSEMLIPISMPWIQFGLSFLVFYNLAKYFKWKRAETGALILTAGLGNTSFIGFPVLEALYGPEAIQIGVLVDQPGSFLTLSILGILVASACSSKDGVEVTAKSIAQKIFFFPPFISVIVAFIWYFSGIEQSPTIVTMLERLSITLVPLALIAVGFQLKVSTDVLARRWKPLVLGLTFKLFLMPLFFLVLFIYVLSVNSLAVRATVIEAAMASMITGAVVAEEFGLDTEIANLMVGIGIPISLGTVYLWDYFLRLHPY